MKTKQEFVDRINNLNHEILQCEDTIRGYRKIAEELHEKKHEVMKLSWLANGGFDVGDKIISSRGEVGICARLRLNQHGHEIRPNMSTVYHTIKKNGSPSKSVRIMYFSEHWTKA